MEKYKTLRLALDAAFDRAAVGKGAERHADGKPFDEQPLFTISRHRGHGFILGQVDKKLDEAPRLQSQIAYANEVLDCIVYLAALYALILEEIRDKNSDSAKAELGLTQPE